MDKIFIAEPLYHKMLLHCQTIYPQQTRGIFISKEDHMTPSDFYPFKSNQCRLHSESKEMFSHYGSYYKDHKGFVTDPLELIKVDNILQQKKERMVGLFHVHIDFPAAPSRLDVETFTNSMPNSENIWYAILSFLNPQDPEFRVFWIREKLVQEIKVCQIFEKDGGGK